MVLENEERDAIEAERPRSPVSQPDEQLSNSNGAIAECLERPLTPISRCLDVGLPAMSTQTEAGLLAEGDITANYNDFNAAILAHAKVYTFAHYHHVPELERFALQRLTQVLLLVDCTQSAASAAVAHTIRHIYENTAARTHQEEPARKLMSHFVALNFTSLMKGEFKTVMSEGGDLAHDLSHKLCNRLLSIGELEIEIVAWKTKCEEKENEARQLRAELSEWESWNSGLSRNMRRKVKLSSHSPEPAAAWD